MSDHPVPIFDRQPRPEAEPHVLADAGQRLPNAGRVVYAPGGAYGPRTQQDYQLVLVHAGAARVYVDGVARDVPASHVTLLLPGKREYFEFARDRETEHSWVALTPPRLDPELRCALDAARPYLPLSPVMHDLVKAGIDTAVVDGPERPVLTAVVRAALTLYVAEAERLPAAHAAVRPLVARAHEIARRRACEGMSVGELAAAVGVSPEHLVRLFRRDLGTTPGAVLRAERVARAIHLLEHTGLSVAEAAWQAGFASPHHCARLLRAATGMTPTELRARHWAG